MIADLRCKIVATFAALFLLPTAGDAADEKAPPILFAVRDLTHSGVAYSSASEGLGLIVEPIALLVDGNFKDVPRDSPGAFSARFYPPHQQYSLLVGGAVAGSLEILKSAYQVQCDSLAAEAITTPRNAVSGMQMALASNWTFPESGFARRHPTSLEDKELAALAQTVYAKNSIGQPLLAKMTLSSSTAFQRGKNRIAAGS